MKYWSIKYTLVKRNTNDSNKDQVSNTSLVIISINMTLENEECISS